MKNFENCFTNTEWPSVSLILVVFNEIDSIAGCVASLTMLDYPVSNIEYLFVDGCSNDGTLAFLQAKVGYLNSKGLRAKLLNNPKRILATGWNVGIREASGEFVCRIDGHSTINPDYIKRGMEELLKPENVSVAAVGGWLTHAGVTKSGRVIAVLLSSKFAVGNSPFRAPPSAVSHTDTAVYGIYRRRVFYSVGLFDETLERNQDMVLHHKMEKAGFSFLTHPGMMSTYYVRSSLKKLLKKAFGDGRWVALAGSRNFSLRHKIPCFFTLYMAAFLLMSILAFITPNIFMKYGLAVAGIPMLFYFLLALWFSIRADDCGAARVFLPPMFILFHLSYGVGTLQGYAEIVTKYGLRFGCRASS